MATQLHLIAEKAKVGAKTVANVLNPKYRHLYNPATVARILAAAEEAGWRPNASARSLQSKRFGTVGLLLSAESQASNLPQGLLLGIESALYAAQTSLLVAMVPDDRLGDPERLPRVLTELVVDGLLVDYNSGIPQVLREQVAAAGRPAVWLNADLPTDAVRPDDRGAAVALAARLAEAGHRWIAWLDESYYGSGGRRHYSKEERRAGLAAGCAAHGVRLTIIDDDPEEDPLLTRVQRLLATAERPTAVVCYGAEYREVIDAMARAGGQLGRDVVSVAFTGEGVAMFGRFPVVPVEVPERACGARAVERLLARIAGTCDAGWASDAMPFAIPSAKALALRR